MSIDLVLKAACERCGSTSDLYGTNCKHTTLCLSCGKAAAASRGRCHLCAAPVTNLIREYNVRASANTDKNFYIGRFATGLPPFSKKKNAENKWTLHKEGLQGRQLTDSLKEKYKNKPWILEDETGQHQFQGQIEGPHSATATYYLLMLQGKEFVAYPAGSWYNFNKIAQYKQLTLEEAEEKMNKRRNNADGYERWLMKAATNGAAAFGETKNEGLNNSGVEGNRSKKGKGLDDRDHSEKGDQDEEEDEDRKNRLGLTKKSVDDEEGGKEADFDLDDDDIEKGDDWEHEEVFTDDDEAVGNDPEEKEDLAPDIPAPPEIKQDEEDENEEEDAELSKSGKELKKLLGKAAGLNESDADDDDDDDEEDDVGMSPVLAPKQKENSKDEPAENTPSKASAPNGSTRATPATSKSSKAKRKPGNDDQKATNNAPAAKKAKAEHSVVKDEPTSAKPNVPMKPSASASKSGSTSSTVASSTAPVTEDEIRNVLRAHAPVTTQDLVAKFKARLKSQEDKKAFADILRGMSKIQKINGHSYVVLRDK